MDVGYMGNGSPKIIEEANPSDSRWPNTLHLVSERVIMYRVTAGGIDVVSARNLRQTSHSRRFHILAAWQEDRLEPSP